jgi:GAF domain-containing protein
VEGLRKDGSQFPVEISVAAQKLEERYRFTAVLRDITARRQAEATLAALNAATLAAQQARTPDEVYAAVGDALRDLGLSLVVVAPDPTGEHLVIRYGVLKADQARVLEKALGQAVQRIRFPLASLPAYSTYWQSGQAEFRRDLLTYVKGRAARKLARAGLKALGNPACIDAPFTDESGVTGALMVFGADLSARDVPTMDLFARQMSAALERTRLHQETTQLANALTGLFQCSQKLTVSQTPQAIFATLFRYIQGIFGFSIGSLALYDSDAQSLRFTASRAKNPLQIGRPAACCPNSRPTGWRQPSPSPAR